MNTEPMPPVTYEDIAHLHALIDEANGRMGRMERAIEDNTAITNEVREILTAAKAGFRVLGGVGIAAQWLAKILALCGAAYGIWHTWHSGGPK